MRKEVKKFLIKFFNGKIENPMSGTSLVLIVFEIIVLLFSAILHEIAHGYEAERLGDDTARRAGRLTLNPLVHLDLFTSILMPILLIWVTNGAFFFAAAKPVPYNPNNLKNPRSGSAKIALAGPLTNFFIALVFSIAVRILVFLPVSGTLHLVPRARRLHQYHPWDFQFDPDSAARRLACSLCAIAAEPEDVSDHVFP